VAVVLDPPTADEVNGLRRALGDTSLDRIPPHLTLVPPVNVPAASVGAALAVLRRAAAATPPLRLALGPVVTFAPASPVLYLGVGGDLEGLRRLRDAVFSPPLARPLTWPWVPHVTVADDASPPRIAAATASLDRYAAVAEVDRVVVLEELDHRWVPLADALLGGRSVVATGGLALELTAGRLLGPEGWALVAADAGGAHPCPRRARRTVVVSARREGQLVGVAQAWVDDAGGHVGVFVRPGARRQGVGGHLLAAAESAVVEQGWECPLLAAEGPAGFYRRRSAYSRAAYSKATEE
jgi:2'-5' RNA ligase